MPFDMETIGATTGPGSTKEMDHGPDWIHVVRDEAHYASCANSIRYDFVPLLTSEKEQSILHGTCIDSCVGLLTASTILLQMLLRTSYGLIN